MQKRKLQEHERPLPHQVVKVKEMGNITEVMYSRSRNHTCSIKKLSNDKYILLDTGEELDFNHMDNRADDKNSIRVSLSYLRDYLNTNITDVTLCRWVTLTYAENMTDTKRLKKDFEKFIKKVRYKYGHFEYIVAMEPQGRGAWHCHVVMIFEGKAPYIPNTKLREMWGNGFVTVKKLDDVDNVGAYLTAYLGDMELEQAQAEGISMCDYDIKVIEIVDDKGQKKPKAFLKGARLSMYPPQFNLYRCSRGIKKPVIEYVTEENAQKKISADTLTFERTIELSDDASGFNNTINYRYYNVKRKRSQ